MRIISGLYRGRRLASVGKGDEAAHLRPTTDRVRESLFNLLVNGGYGDPITDARVLDVFAGTGALGLEALSRGAGALTCIENGRKAQSLLRENLKILGAQAQIIARDVRKIGVPTCAPFDLVFLDPPYGQGLGEIAMERLDPWIAPEALIVWEESKAPQITGGYTQLDARRYGETVITILRKD